VRAREATELGQRVAALLQSGQTTEAYSWLAPVLAQHTPFSLLGRIGEQVGAGPLPTVNAFLERIAAARTEGGWVVIGSALGQQLGRDLAGAFARCRAHVVAGDVWYATDILGERVPGPALVADLSPAMALLAPWREDANRWVRRTTGVAVHFWSKRSRGAPRYAAEAQALLAFLDPLFEERDQDAIKGVGWGLKTLGRYYPELVTDWLVQQIAQHKRHPRALMLHKAMTYLPAEQRDRIIGDVTG
jgi:hypothetical protein